ncbi:MAG: ABC transporter permease subunit [Kiritimatiellaeota bacterium]|nr:ABC transporter permease subunit [Kiritimatiellota bacterium]
MTALVQTAGIFLQALRANLRGRGAWVLPALLAANALLLPRALRGDGTVEAGYTLAVRYTLGFTAFVLAIKGAASGAAAMASDRRSGALALTLAKPARAAALFAGKWLGALAACALMLAASHALVLLPLRLNPETAARMASRGVVGATLAPARDVARAAFERMRREGTLPEGVPEREVLRDLARQAGQGYDVAGGGESIEWRFDLPRPLKPGAEIGLRVTFDQQWGMIGAARGSVALRPAGAEGWAAEATVEGAVLQEVEAPFKGFDPAGCKAFEARFTNLGGEDAEPVLIHPGRGVALLVYGGNFWANAVRAYALQLALVAVFTALGVALGAAFSMPVAVFAATVLYVLSMIAPALAEEDFVDEDEKPGFLTRAGRGVTTALQKGFDPLVSPEPLARLTRGEKIPAGVLAQSLGAGFFVFPGLALLVFCGILKLRDSQEDG